MTFAFDITLTRRTVSAPGALSDLGRLVTPLGRRALVAIGGGSVRRSGVLDRALTSLTDAGLTAAVFEGIEPDPSTETANAAAEACRASGAEVVIGLGGGSVLDCAKAAAILATHEGDAAEYQMGQRRFERPGLPYVAIPTTSGTGSEANRVAVLTNTAEGIKKSIMDSSMVPALAVLDPELTVSLPPFETAYTGIDALSHAAESFVSLNATPVTSGWSAEALQLIGTHLPRAVADGADPEARAAMQVASALGGATLNAGVGCAHILAHPLGATFGIPHGAAIAAVLPAVFEANSTFAEDRYAQIARALDAACASLTDAEAAARAGDALRHLLERIGLCQRLGERGVTAADFGRVYEGVGKSMAHIKTNPRPATRELLESIFVASL